MNALFAPYNADLFNSFTMLLNGMNQTYVESKRFTNPLRELLKPSMRFGNTERHVAVKYLQAHSARADSETLQKLELPEYREWFYSVGEPRRYEFSWPRYEMERAFADPDGYGFNDLLAATIDQAVSSNEYDQMNIMVQMFAEADQRLGGLYREQLSAAPTTKEAAQELLVKVRAAAGRMKFPTTLYNHIDIAVHETPETLIFWCTPETRAYINVMALADLLNWQAAAVEYRVIEIPEFPIPNVYAALTSEDFIYGREVGYGIEPPFYNPEQRAYKYYLFDAEMLGINPVANCVLFTTDAATVTPTVTVTPTGLAFTPAAGNAWAGGVHQLSLELNGTIENDNAGPIAVEPDAALYTVAAARGADSEAQPVALNSRTFVDDYGRLHVQKSGIEAGDVITVTAKSVYVNPSGTTETFTASYAATVIDRPTQGAKECSVETEPYIEYTDETEQASASE